MSTLFRYTLPVEETNWKFQGAAESSFTWEYDAQAEDLLKLYAKGKQQQWDADKRIDWIFVKGVQPESITSVTTRWNHRYPSDHFPLVMTLRLP